MSHSQHCIDSNRFGDGFDCVCEPVFTAADRSALAAADAAAIETIRETIRELTYANEQRRLVIDALERKLEEAAGLALANGMRADAAERRIAAALQWEDDGLEGDALIYHMLEELRGE